MRANRINLSDKAPLLSSQKGLSMVELMVALTLSMILLAGVLQLFSNMNHGYIELVKSSRQLENGRYATQLIVDDLRHAGFYGPLNQNASTPAAVPDPCETDVGDIDSQDAIAIPIQAYNGVNSTAPISCLTNYKANTDVLVLRRASTTTTDVANLDDSDDKIFLQSNIADWILDEANNSDPGNASDFNLDTYNGTALAPIRRFLVHIYYISSCSDCSGSGDGIPTLRRLELDDDGDPMINQALVDGIENMQLDLGIAADADDEVVEVSGGDWAVDPPSAAEVAAGPVATINENWMNILSVGVNLLSRSSDRSLVPDKKTYTLGQTGGAVDPSGDDEYFKRQYFSSIARIENVAARRETP